MFFRQLEEDLETNFPLTRIQRPSSVVLTGSVFDKSIFGIMLNLLFLPGGLFNYLPTPHTYVSVIVCL